MIGSMVATPHRALLFLYAETPVHAGGEGASGALDLPIQREVGTGYPIIKGESLKGALREHTRSRLDPATWTTIFGAEPPKRGQAAGPLTPGSIRVHEAQLVALPVPTLVDTFAWALSPLVRARLARRASLVGVEIGPADTPDDPGDDSAWVVGGTNVRQNAVLGSYQVTAQGSPNVREWAAAVADLALPPTPEHAFFRNLLAKRLYVVSADLFKALSRECTPVVARVQLGAEVDGVPTKTVAHGPFYSEYLPAETVMVALLETRRVAELDTLAGELDGQVVQVGGDETVGKGLMWCRVVRPGTQAGEADS
ncbi:type III-B CRISPR module RAMP protein Cmr4 [Actinomadura pelletieri]|uniref:type III-B CRISPR module RAMP protein Cmr4 n=1 Tax=Actinomadura pelletieri TaxID=111805 RepID=UPI0014772BD0|nr:type III-B CRISPR module RAMP protein Cmr4 [Actinomadura pelletieri]